MPVFLSPMLLGYEEFLSHIKTEAVAQMLLFRAPFLPVALYGYNILLDHACDRIRVQGVVLRG